MSSDDTSTHQVEDHNDSQHEGQANSGFHGGNAPNFELRCLIENSAVGGLIGRSGSNVKRVREESGAFVSILATDNRQVTERILTIKGSIDSIAKAVLIISQLLIDGGSDVSRSADTTALKVLVHKSAVGAVIGKAGAVIKETQNETGARIQVSNEPIGQSTDKTVTVSGTPQQLHDAVARIAQQLKESPLKPGTRSINFVPGTGNSSAPASHTNAGYNAGGRGGYNNTRAPAAPVAGEQTQKIAIPTLCAGCVIGRGGSVIRDLRAQSGTAISIQDPDPQSPNERVVTLTGTREGIQTAVYLIRQLVEQYQPDQQQQQRQHNRQNNAQPQQEQEYEN